jgi:hypothetical protein
MIDDHIPFAVRGIPAVDLIDFDYPYWHTTADTIDKISAESLERVGRTLETFLESPLTSSAFVTFPRAFLSCESTSRAWRDATDIFDLWRSFANPLSHSEKTQRT